MGDCVDVWKDLLSLSILYRGLFCEFEDVVMSKHHRGKKLPVRGNVRSGLGGFGTGQQSQNKTIPWYTTF